MATYRPSGLLALALLAASAPAQRPAPLSRTLLYEYCLRNPSATAARDVTITTPLPLASDRQQLHYVRHHGGGAVRRFRDDDGQDLLEFRLEELAPGTCQQVTLVLGVTIDDGRRRAPRRGAAVADLTGEERRRYLRAESNYSMDDPRMREVASTVGEGDRTDLEKLILLHDWVAREIEFENDNQWLPAADVLENGSGSCSEYHYVLSGLCRLAGLPTRSVGGTLHRGELPAHDRSFHRWTEVFVRDRGWLPVDASLEEPHDRRRSKFGHADWGAVVWSVQAGGDDSSLGWEYRARFAAAGGDPGLIKADRCAWHEFVDEQQFDAALRWCADGDGAAPSLDALEAAAASWDDLEAAARDRLVRALAAGGRVRALRCAARLPEPLRRQTLQELLVRGDLAERMHEWSKEPGSVFWWFHRHGGGFVPADGGRFAWQQRAR